MFMTSRQRRQGIAAVAVGFVAFASATGCETQTGIDTRQSALGSASLVRC